VFIAELGEGGVEFTHLLHALVVAHWVVVACEPFEAVALQHAFLDGVQSPPGESPLFVDELVIHNATEPGAGLLDVHEIVDLAVGLNKEFLEQVLGFGLTAGQSPGQAIEPVEMGSDDTLERVAVLSDDRLLAIVKAVMVKACSATR